MKIRVRTVVKLPASLQAAGGLNVEKKNGRWTFGPDWNVLALETTLPDAASRHLWTLNPNTGVYTRLSVQTLIDNLPRGPAGETAVGTVTPLSPGATPTVTNSGTPTHAVLDFGLPETPTIAIGTVTTVGSSDPATVTNSGTSSSIVLDFDIPKGPAGAMGGPGSSVDGEITIYDGTSGTSLKRANQTGVLKATSGVIGTASSGEITALVDAASDSAAGKVELATNAEAQAKADTTRVITPSNLSALGATDAFAGFVELATLAEALTGTDTSRVITADVLRQAKGASRASFLAHKNGTDQTGIPDVTFTTVTFSTEEFDVGGFFASNAWTPPAGTVLIGFSCLISGTFTTGNQISAIIRKNGTSILQFNTLASSSISGGSTNFHVVDAANGTDVYIVQVYADVNSGSVTVSGNTSHTKFWGTAL